MTYIAGSQTLTQPISQDQSVKNQSVKSKFSFSSPALSDSPSAIELFSYGVCCVAQGVVLLTYFGLVVFVPIALSQGL